MSPATLKILTKFAASIAIAFLALVFASVLSGCANLVIRPNSDYNNGPYFCTRQINTCISKGLDDGHPITRAFLPCFFIDWPFDALADTLLWPYDAIAYNNRF